MVPISDGNETFIKIMDLEQALSSIRRLGAGQTTFLIALKDVKSADPIKNLATIDMQIAEQPDSYIMRLFVTDVRRLREGMGDPLSVTRHAQDAFNEHFQNYEAKIARIFVGN
jgi:hypothetical protein